MSEFTGKIASQVWSTASETQKLMSALLSDGGDARFVGGCVRNTLANKEVLDIDIATPLMPEEVIACLKKHEIKVIPTGIEHGTVTAVVDGKVFEITTLRQDVENDGRHAVVSFTDDWEKDAARRDFTMNTIYMTVGGDLYDPFEGIKDLRIGRVAFVGDADLRIEEDVLRILRFFRFFAHFGKGEIDTVGLKACQAAVHKIETLSKERIRQEVLKLLEADRAADVWKTMLSVGVVQAFLPEAVNTDLLQKLIDLEIKENIPAFSLRRLAALLENNENIGEKLKLSNRQEKQIFEMSRISKVFSEDMFEKDVKILLYHTGVDLVKTSYLLFSARRGLSQEVFSKFYNVIISFKIPKFPLKGQDVMDAGVAAGPDVGSFLKNVETWWIEKDFKPTREMCLQHLSSIIK